MLKKLILNLFRFLVGGLFIFSGLIKVNDPVGTSIKLKEYFEVFSHDIASFFKVFMPYALPIAVFLIVLEVVLGVMLIFNFKKNLTINLLLLLIVFFTFLTFYSAYFNKVTDCGCFGDAIKLTPWQSFYKDIVLLVMIGVLFLFKKNLTESNGLGAKIAVSVSFIASLFISIYAIRNLPIIDFRAYKEGVNIPIAMQPSGTLEYRYIMSKEGEEVIFDEYPTDESYEFVDMQLKNPEFLPKISDFAIWNDDGDFTDLMLEGNKVLVLFNSLEKIDRDKLDKISPLVQELKEDIEVVIITASSAEEMELLMNEKSWDVPYYYGDATVVKTMIRSNPGIMLIQDGTIIRKYHINNTPQPEEVKSLFTQ